MTHLSHILHVLFIVMDELRTNITVDQGDTTSDKRCCLKFLNGHNTYKEKCFNIYHISEENC